MHQQVEGVKLHEQNIFNHPNGVIIAKLPMIVWAVKNILWAVVSAFLESFSNWLFYIRILFECNVYDKYLITFSDWNLIFIYYSKMNEMLLFRCKNGLSYEQNFLCHCDKIGVDQYAMHQHTFFFKNLKTALE